MQIQLRLLWQLLLLLTCSKGTAWVCRTRYYNLKNKSHFLVIGKLCQGRSLPRNPAQQMYELTLSIPTHSYLGRIHPQARLKPLLHFSPLSRRSWHWFSIYNNYIKLRHRFSYTVIIEYCLLAVLSQKLALRRVGHNPCYAEVGGVQKH